MIRTSLADELEELREDDRAEGLHREIDHVLDLYNMRARNHSSLPQVHIDDLSEIEPEDLETLLLKTTEALLYLDMNR